ncbi:AAA family ATPase [Halomonas sp. RA08-2]|uniref:AAA family ATPase n=1 Tax=Halomonas sp. RA08-2 TaxID=3440842 RepID=UPI003EF05C26
MLEQKKSPAVVGEAQAKQSTDDNSTDTPFPLYASVKDTRPAKAISLAELAVMASAPTVGPKNQAQALTPFHAQGKQNPDAEAALFYAAVQDHDDDDQSYGEIADRYNGHGRAFLAFTTGSHLQDKNGITAQRWKVILPFSRPVDFERYHRLSSGLALMLGTDAVQQRKAQVFYAPNKISEDAPYDFIDATDLPYVDPLDDADPLVSACLAAYQAENERKAIERRATPKPRQTTSEANAGIIDKVNAAYSAPELLASAGYRQRGKRYLSPWSSTGTPGVSILERDGKQVVYSHHGESDPLSSLNHDGHSLDAFDIITALEYGGDAAKAVAEMADKVDPEGQKQRQREYMEQKERREKQEALAELVGGEKPFSLSQFSLTGMAQAMKAKMLEDSFVLDNIAIAGQMTCLYAKPNSGKTLMALRLLIDSIKRGDIKGENVYYINADDNYRGLVTKLELAEQHGFHMLAPGHGGFDSSMFAEYLVQMTKDGLAPEVIIILDTLKKFADLMDKQAASRFMNHVREFVSHGGTVIMLAHTNKHRDGDGKLIFAGTSDVVDDIDCAYMIDALDSGPLDQSKTIIMENFKSRGDVASSVTYRYSTQKGQGYRELLGSVEKVTDDEANQAARHAVINRKLEHNQEVIDTILEAIGGSSVPKQALIDAAGEVGISRKRVARVIKEHTGTNYMEGHRWRMERGEKNTQLYTRLLSLDAAYKPSDDYDVFADGSE